MSSEKIDLNSISMLVPLAKDGDRTAQNEILKQVQDYILSVANGEYGPDMRRRVNPSDLVQLTMSRMVEGFDGFRGTTRNELIAWIGAIVKNEVRSTRRNIHNAKRDIKRERDNSTPSGNWIEPGKPDPLLTPSSNAIKEEKVRQLQTAISRLSADHAEVIQLRNFDELSFQEIAERMGRTYDSTAKLWQRAVVQLQKELESLD